MKAVTRRQGVGLDRELVQCVGKRVGQVGVGEGVNMAAAVEDVVVVDALAAGDGDDRGIGVGFAAVDIVARSIDGAARDEDELGRLATVQGKLGDALLIDDLLEGTGLGVERGAGGLHLDVLT